MSACRVIFGVLPEISEITTIWMRGFSSFFFDCHAGRLRRGSSEPSGALRSVMGEISAGAAKSVLCAPLRKVASLSFSTKVQHLISNLLLNFRQKSPLNGDDRLEILEAEHTKRFLLLGGNFDSWSKRPPQLSYIKIDKMVWTI